MNFLDNLLLMLILMLIGFAAGKWNILKKEDTGFISNLIYYITAPAMVFHNMATSFRRDQLMEGAVIPLIAAFLTIGFVLVAKGAGRLSGIPREKASIFTAASAFSNTIFLGLPVITSMYGPEATFFVVLYDLGSTLVFWMLGVLIVSESTKVNAGQFRKALLNFPLICFVLGLIVVLLSLPIPNVVLRLTKELGGITTPMAMIFVGLTLSGASLESYRKDATLKTISFLRLAVMPSLALLCIAFLPLSVLLKKVVIIEAAMPVMITTAIIAKKFEKDYEYATRTVVTTTLLFFLTVPLFGVLLNILFR